jgi:DNA-binding response OmpR family regulator
MPYKPTKDVTMDFTQLYQQTKSLSVLLAEDHTPTRLSLEEMLQDLFCDVQAFSNGMDAYNCYEERITDTPFDLVITDIQMPHMNGVTLIKQIKTYHPQQQIIVLSAHTDKEYLIELINIGISHFLAKPFEYDTFLQTLFTVTKQIAEKKGEEGQKTTVLSLGENLTWETETEQLKHHDTRIELSRNELFLMKTLAKNGERITTTQEMIEALYLAGIDTNEHGIRNLVLRLRKKLPEDIIGTVYGMGYKLLLT